MKRKNIALIGMLLLCVLVGSVGFGVTYSYLITSDKTVNSFRVGEVKTEIVEDYIPPQQLLPNSSFDKAPYAVNVGNLPCYVRMRADFTTIKAANFCSLSGIDSNYWEKDNADGYYYYKYILAPGEKTEKPVFEKVIIGNCSVDDIEDFDITVYVEAVQHTDHEGNHAADEYKSVWDDYQK